MTIQQTVDIPAGHRLTIDVPREIPTGPVVLTFTPKAAESAEPEEPAQSATPITDFLSGLCASAGNITLEQIREERLVKRYHLT
jgi:hypothetical protein